MAFVMGVVTMIRVTKNVPRKLTESTIYSSPVYCDDNSMIKSSMQAGKMATTTISGDDFMAVMKRIAELEQKVTILSAQPITMPPEKEEMLNDAISRADFLEQELAATKKVTSNKKTFILLISCHLSLSPIKELLYLHRLLMILLADKRTLWHTLRERRRRRSWFVFKSMVILN